MANPKFHPTITSGQEGDTLLYRSGEWVNGPRGILVPNGIFADNAAGWIAGNGDETLTWEATTGVSAGSGRLAANRASGSCRITYAPDNLPMPLYGVQLVNAWVWVTSPHASVTAFIRFDWYSSGTSYNDFVANTLFPAAGWTVTTSFTQFGRSGILVPAGATHFNVNLSASGLDGTDPVRWDDLAVWGV